MTRAGLKRIAGAIACALVLARPVQAQDPVVSDLVLGERIELGSVILDEVRILNVYLPDEYADSTHKRYPLVLVLDGAMNEDFLHIAGLCQYAAFDWVDWRPDAIVVGIESIDRRHDFTTPARSDADKQAFPTSGGSGDFLAFMESELLPWLHAYYRTDGDDMLIGQSLGGLLATEALWRNPGLFDRYIIVSPSAWWNDGEHVTMAVATHFPENAPRQIYIAVGDEEKVMKKGAYAIARRAREQFPTAAVRVETLSDEDHATILHTAVMRAFRWMAGSR